MSARKPITLPTLREMHAAGQKIAMLTCYDATMASVLDAAGVDVLLVGDSLGMVVQGRDSTLPVTMQDVAYHTRCVARGRRNAWLIADLPFQSYRCGWEEAVECACVLMQAGANMVKLEGGGWTAEIVDALVERGIPVCAHLGLLPQSMHALGGWRVQGRSLDAATGILSDATMLADAGASMLVLELVPTELAARLQASIDIPVIGIGAGPDVAGQVLVLHDMLGLGGGRIPRFVRNFAEEVGPCSSPVLEAVQRYVSSVKQGLFPDPERHGYK